MYLFQWYSFGLRAGWSGVLVPAEAGNFSLHHRVHGREAGHSPAFSAEVQECVELYLLSHNMPSWGGAQFKKKNRDNFTLLLMC
jgi:hypothetical protein